MKKILIFCICLVYVTIFAFAPNISFSEDEIFGCTDSQADNFDPLANTDDGSCIYSPPSLQSFYTSTSNGTYSTGNVISIYASFNKDLAPGSSMTIELDTGAVIDLVNVDSSLLYGAYTVSPLEETPDLSVVGIISANISDTLTPVNTGTNYSIPVGSNINDNNDILIISIPVVVNVTSPNSNGVLDRGETFTIEINFTEPVNVIGNPRLASNEFSSITKYFNFISGSSTNKLVFAYQIQDGDIKFDRVPTQFTFDLNGGSVKGLDGDDASLSIPEIGQGGSLVESRQIYINARSNIPVVPKTSFYAYYTTPVNQNIYAFPNSSSPTINSIDAISNTVNGTIEVESNNSYHSLPVVAGSKVYFFGPNVKVLDSKNDQIISTIGTAGYGGVLYNDKLYKLTQSGVAVINVGTDTIIDTIDTGYSNTSGTYPFIQDKKLYIPIRDHDVVSVIDLENDQLITNIDVADVPSYVAGITGKVYVTHSNTDSVTVIDTNTNTVIGNISVGDAPISAIAFAGHIYVSNGEDNSISVIDANSDTVVDVIDMGGTPYYAYVVNDLLYVPISGASLAMKVIDPSTNDIISSIPVDGATYSLSSNAGYVYVTNTNTNTVTVIDSQSRTVEEVRAPRLLSFTSANTNRRYISGETISIQAQFNQELNPSSEMVVTLNTGDSITLNNVSGSILEGEYVVSSLDNAVDLNVESIVSANISNNDTIPDVDTSYRVPASPEFSWEKMRNLADNKNILVGNDKCVIEVGTNPYQMAVYGDFIYVVNMGSDDVSVVNKNTNEVVDTIEVGDEPYGVTISGTNLYVANLGSNNVSVISLLNNNVVNTINVGVEPYYVTSIGSNVYVTNNVSNSVSVINTITREVTDEIRVGTAPRGIKAYGNYLYVANYGGGYTGSVATGTVSVIDSLNNTVVDTVETGFGPRGVTVNGDKIYVANFLENTVSVIDTNSNSLVDTIAVGDGPRGITSKNGYVYVENYSDGTVSVIDVSNGNVVATIDVGNTPSGILATDDYVYVTRFTDDLVSIIDPNTLSLVASCPFVEQEADPSERDNRSRKSGGRRNSSNISSITPKILISNLELSNFSNDSAANNQINVKKYDNKFTRDLTVGFTGEDVRNLQKYLNSKGFIVSTTGPGSMGNETTTFGPLTRAALARFQASVGITPAVGYFGPITRAYIANN